MTARAHIRRGKSKLFTSMHLLIARVFYEYYGTFGSVAARDFLDGSIPKLEQLAKKTRLAEDAGVVEILDELNGFGHDEADSPEEYGRKNVSRLHRIASKANRLLMPRGYTNLAMLLYAHSTNLDRIRESGDDFEIRERQGLKEPYNADKTAVFDLDKSLVYCSEKPFASSQPLNIDGETFYFSPRPHLDGFLDDVARDYEMMVWSSSSTDYIGAITNELDITDRFFRLVGRDFVPMSTIGAETAHQKRLKKLGRDLSKVLIIEDRPEKFQCNYGNGIQIKPWTGDSEDKELLRLANYLRDLKKIDDVRKVEKRGWENRYQP